MLADSKTTWVEISKSAIKHNYNLLSKAVYPARVIAVLKADAYGHGAKEIAEIVDSPMIAVARIEEAVELREAEISKSILVLSPLINNETIKYTQSLSLML